MANLVHLKNGELDNLLENNKIAVVDLWATWCNPCKMLGPIFEQLATSCENNGVAFAKVNVDEASEIATKCGVMSVPTVIFFKDGVEVQREIGFHPLDFYKNILNGLI